MSAIATAIAADPVPVLSISPERLSATLRAVIPFVCTDETRFHLATVAVAVKGGLVEFVATNGHCLVRANPVGVKLDGPDRVVALLPLASVKEIAARAKAITKTTAHVTLELAPQAVTYRDSTGSLTFKPLNSEYPAYEAVIPKVDDSNEPSAVIGIDPKYLSAAAEAAKAFLSQGRYMDITLEMRACGPIDPIRFDARNGSLGSITIVVMPRRI